VQTIPVPAEKTAARTKELCLMRRFAGFLPAAVVTAVLSIASSTWADEERLELKLWPDGAPGETGEIGPEEWKTSEGDRPVTRVHNVSEPILTVYPAAADQANGCAVVIAPGGGYSILAYDLEGTEVAEWLNSIGVTALLLKYRVPRRDKDAPHAAPLQDAQRALRLARQHAAAWKIDPQRIGMLGFSAGGNLTVLAGTHWDQKTYEAIDDADQLSCRPDFLIPVYPAYLGDAEQPNGLSPLVRISDRTPPTFLLVTLDDKDRGVDCAYLLAALKKAGVAAELHVFTKGGHGYGLRPSDRPVSGWPKLCTAWMREMGLLERNDR
jgi:acetyl esterase/lipase